MPVTITVRHSRDRLASAEARLEVVMVFESRRPSDIGERLELPDGSSALVMNTIERSDAAGVTQSVFVTRL